jgi:hypothetical protein
MGGRRLIGLCGWAGCGKDYLASQLGWHRAAFADELKSDVCKLLDILPSTLEKNKAKYRKLLVAYGETKRADDLDHWIGRIKLVDGVDGVDTVITDLRYPNEARWVIGQGGKVIYVHRHGIFPANPEEQKSVAELLGKYEHTVLYNDEGAIERLKVIAEAA